MAGNRVISAVLTLKDRDFSSNAKKASSALTDTQRQAKHSQNAVSNFGSAASSSFKSVAIGATSVAAAFIGMSAVKNFAVGMVESAASAQAVSAQFEQVFGNVQSNAQSTVDELGKSFGMVSDRIKPAFTQMTSMFKGLGMDTEDAMKQATSAVTLASDAAAFYDKSYEDANGALNSFIKGNYEGGEAIGLFANETQMASWATKNLGVDWKNLDEAGKQVARLEFAKSMQEAAGATGQAARESDSYENQLGNLRKTWDNLKAQLGAPILEPAVQGLKSLATWVGNIDTDKIINDFIKAGTSIKDSLVGAYTAAKPGIDWLKDTAFPALKDGIGYATDKAKELYDFIADNWSAIGPVVAGIATTVATFRLGVVAITTATTIWTAVTAASQVATALLNGTLAISPLGWVALAIGAVVAIGIVLWKNWDTIKQKTSELWERLGGFKGIVLSLLGPIGSVIAIGVSLYQNWDTIKARASTMASDVKTKVLDMKDNVVTWFGELKDGAVKKFDDLVSSAQKLPGRIGQGIKEYASEAADGIADLAKGLLTKFKSVLGIKSPSREFFKMAKWIAQGLVGGLNSENLKDLGMNAFEGFADGAFKSLDAIKGFLSGGMVNFKAGAGVQQWAGLAAQALSMTGQYSEANLQRLLMQMQSESGGNPNSINLWDSNAKKGIPSKGLMQVIDPTFKANAMPGYSSNVYDPLSNMLASIRYSTKRYGSLTNAWKGKGYAQGGQITSTGTYLTSEQGPEIIDLPVGSRVHNAQNSKRMQRGENKFEININGYNKSVNEILSELVPQLKLRLANM